MTPLAILAAVAAVIAVAAVTVRRPSRGRAGLLAVTGLLTAAGVALVVGTERPAAARMVVVVDLTADDPGGAAEARVTQVLDRVRETGLAGYDVVLIGDPVAGSEPAADSGPEVARPWRTGGVDLSAGLPAGGPADAIRVACRRLRERSLTERLADTIALRERRVVVVVTAPGRWSGWSLPVAEAVREVRAAGAVADLVVGDGSDPSASLELVGVEPGLVPDARPPDRAVVRLRLRAPAVRDHRGPIRYTATATLNPGSPDSARSFRLTDFTGEAASGPTGGLEFGLPLGKFRRASDGRPGVELPAGFHLLEVAVTADAGGRTVRAGCEEYLPVDDYRQVVFVAGQRPGGATKAALRRAWDQLPRYRDRWPAGVRFQTFWDEGELATAAAGPAPFVVVLHELSDAGWPAAAPVLAKWLAAGTHLIVSGSPPDEPAVLQALPGLPHRGRWRFARRPRLVFVTDESRLARLPVAPGGAGELAETKVLKDRTFARTGLAYQQEYIRRVCAKLGDNGPEVSFDPSGSPTLKPAAKDYLEVGVVRDQSGAATTPAGLGARLKGLAPGGPGVPGLAARAADEVGLNDVVVVFAWDGVNEPDGYGPVLGELLLRGARVVRVPLKTPFVAGVNKAAPGAAFDRARVDEFIKKSSGTTVGPLTAPDATAGFADGQPISQTTQAAGGADDGLEAAAADVMKRVEAVLGPAEAVLVRHRLDRVFDERVGPAAGTGARPPASAPASAAPLRFTPLTGGQLPYASVAWPQGAAGRSATYPVVAGGPVGRGSLLVFGYSLFEGADTSGPAGPPAHLGVPFASYAGWPPSQKVFHNHPDDVDKWGPQRVIDVATLADPLEPLVGSKPRLRAARVVDNRGRVRFESAVAVTAAGPADLSTVILPTVGESITLTPSGLSPERGRVYHELPPQAAARLLGNVAGGGQLKSAFLTVNEVTVFLRGRPVTGQADLQALGEMAAVARYTGGDEATPATLPPRPAGVRGPAAVLFGVVLAALWTTRAARRARARRATSRRADAEAGAVMVDTAEGVVAQVGESLGRAVPNLRAGAFAGLRPFEPGDRLDAAHRTDLLLAASCGVGIVPRVPLRIDDRTTRLLIRVQLGWGVRSPAGGRRPPPKLAVAATVAELLAAMAWARRAEVTIASIGLSRAVAPLGPLPASPGDGEVTRYLSRCLTSPPGSHPPDRPDLEGGSVVTVSDFLNDDPVVEAAEALAAEQDGAKAGAVLVWSPAEFSLLDLGVVPGSGVLADRGLWAAADLEGVHGRFVERAVAAWDGTAGGLVSVSAGLRPEQVLETLGGGRLLDLLR